MSSSRRFSRNDDAGVALIAALFAVVVLSGLVVLFVARSLAESRFSANSRDFEQSLHVAEAGADALLGALNDEGETPATQIVTTNETAADPDAHEYDPSPNERAWAIALARADPDGMVHTADGDTYAIRPFEWATDATGTPFRQPLPLLFGVSFVPGFDAPNPKVRVVKMQIERTPFVPRFAIETGGDLKFGGSASIRTAACNPASPDPATCNADIHVNGSMTTTGSAHDIQGTVTVAGAACPATNSTGGCRGPGDGVEVQELPEIAADDFYSRDPALTPDPSTGVQTQWYDLCAGVVRLKGTTPCTGTAVWPDPANPSSTFRGWSYKAPANTWEARNGLDSGVYFVHHSDADVNGTAGAGARAVSIFVSQDPASPTNSGSLSLSGQPRMVAAFPNVLFVTDADLKMKGTSGGGNSACDPATQTCDLQSYSGFISVGEQVDVSGNVSLSGAMLAHDTADVHGLVKRNTAGINGSMILDFQEQKSILLNSRYTITHWTELSPGNAGVTA